MPGLLDGEDNGDGGEADGGQDEGSAADADEDGEGAGDDSTPRFN